MKILNWLFAFLVIVTICYAIGFLVEKETSYKALFAAGYLASRLLSYYEKENEN